MARLVMVSQGAERLLRLTAIEFVALLAQSNENDFVS
jgi:hypothetical protein